MPFLERNDFEVAAQIRTYRSPRHALEFVLFPMVHVASPNFYAGVERQLSTCPYILYEGVGSSAVRMLTTSYRIMSWRPRLGLVEQRQALPVAKMSGQLIHADQTRSEFDANWSGLPLRTRLFVSAVAPIVGISQFLTATRSSIARRLDRDSRQAAAQAPPPTLAADDIDRFEEVILDRRDAKLLSTVAAFAREHSGEATRAAVVYGAAHMEAVATMLSRSFRYHCAEASRVRVFSL